MKQVVVGMAALLCVAPGVVAAQETPRVKAERRGGAAVHSLRSGELSVMQTLARDVVSLRLQARGDVVWFTADAGGNVSVGRGRKTRSFSVRTGSTREQSAVRDMLAGSNAWLSFDTLMRSTSAAAPPSAAMRPAHAMVWLVQGDYRPLLTLAAGVAAPASAIRLVRQDCATVYSTRLDEIWNELVSCLDTWNPLQTAWCAYEYDFKLIWAGWQYADCLL